jgi:hypothetical protein
MNKNNILVTVMVFCGNTTKVIGAESAEWHWGKLYVVLADHTKTILTRDEVFAVAPRCIAVGPASAQICPCAACFANRNIG